MPSPYDLLGVDASASASEIRRAYRRCVQRHHPDRHQGSAESHRLFLDIQEAYAQVATPARREAWDARHRTETEGRGAAVTPAPFQSDRAPSWSQWASDWREWWADRNVLPLAPAGDHLTLDVPVPLAKIVRGTQQTVDGRVAEPCGRCRGDDPRCRRCGGTGQRLRDRTWLVTIPPGTPDGALLRLAGAGHHGPRFSRPGDVRIRIRWTRRRGWAWTGDRLETGCSIPVALARTGGPWALRTPSGQSGWVRIPAGTQDGSWLAVQGLGFDAQGRPAAAYIRVRVG